MAMRRSDLQNDAEKAKAMTVTVVTHVVQLVYIYLLVN